MFVPVWAKVRMVVYTCPCDGLVISQLWRSDCDRHQQPYNLEKKWVKKQDGWMDRWSDVLCKSHEHIYFLRVKKVQDQFGKIQFSFTIVMI